MPFFFRSHNICISRLNNYTTTHARTHIRLYNKKWGVSQIHVLSVIASKKGLSELLRHHPDVRITIGHIDEELNAETGDVMPGLGDAGDRLFGTNMVDDEEELVHPSKRKRTMSVDIE